MNLLIVFQFSITKVLQVESWPNNEKELRLCHYISHIKEYDFLVNKEKPISHLNVPI